MRTQIPVEELQVIIEGWREAAALIAAAADVASDPIMAGLLRAEVKVTRKCVEILVSVLTR